MFDHVPGNLVFYCNSAASQKFPPFVFFTSISLCQVLNFLGIAGIILYHSTASWIELFERFETILIHSKWKRGPVLPELLSQYSIYLPWSSTVALTTYVYDIHSELYIWSGKFKRSNDYFCIPDSGLHKYIPFWLSSACFKHFSMLNVITCLLSFLRSFLQVKMKCIIAYIAKWKKKTKKAKMMRSIITKPWTTTKTNFVP